jgi:hypothetical protein
MPDDDSGRREKQLRAVVLFDAGIDRMRYQKRRENGRGLPRKP